MLIFNFSFEYLKFIQPGNDKQQVFVSGGKQQVVSKKE